MTATSNILTQEEIKIRVRRLYYHKGRATEDMNDSAEILNSHAALASRCRELELEVKTIREKTIEEFLKACTAPTPKDDSHEALALAYNQLLEKHLALEQQALRMAEDLYQFGNWKDMKEGYWYCVQCGASWMPGAKQNHKADCLIALAESIIHQHNESENRDDQKAL